MYKYVIYKYVNMYIYIYIYHILYRINEMHSSFPLTLNVFFR